MIARHSRAAEVRGLPPALRPGVKKWTDDERGLRGRTTLGYDAPKPRPKRPGATLSSDSTWRSRRAARLKSRRLHAEHQRQEKAARKALRRFRPTPADIADYAGRLRRDLIEKTLDAGRALMPPKLPEMIGALLKAAESGGVPGKLRLVVLGALVYFAMPHDLIFDVAPLGFGDDLIVARVALRALLASPATHPSDDEERRAG